MGCGARVGEEARAIAVRGTRGRDAEMCSLVSSHRVALVSITHTQAEATDSIQAVPNQMRPETRVAAGAVDTS